MRAKAKLVTIVALCALVACLCACAPSGGDNAGSDASSGDAAAGSLRATHTEEQWETISATPVKKTCFYRLNR